MRVRNNRANGRVHLGGYGIVDPGQEMDVPLALAQLLLGDGFVFVSGGIMEKIAERLDLPDDLDIKLLRRLGRTFGLGWQAIDRLVDRNAFDIEAKQVQDFLKGKLTMKLDHAIESIRAAIGAA